MKERIRIVTNGLVKENPSLRLVLGTCLLYTSLHGVGVIGHMRRKADEQRKAPHQRGVCKIGAKAAEQLLCHHNGRKTRCV